MVQTLVVDTSVFMERIDVLEQLTKEYEIIFPIIVADELNNLKDNKDNEKAYKARKAIKYISEHSNDWLCDADVEGTDNDQTIILVAQQHGSHLVTLDYGMKLRAEILEIPIVEIPESCEKHSGFKTIKLNTSNEDDMETLALYYNSKTENVFECATNEYIIIKQDDLTIDKAKWNGSEYVSLIHSPKKSIIPKSDEQSCAIDLLLDKEVQIKVIYGSAGSGKTFLATRLALDMLKSPDYPYEKIVLVRNPVGTGERIGFLKGDKEDKIQSFFQPFIQHFEGDIFEFENMVHTGRVAMEIPYYMKGLDLTNTLVIFDEAEDSNEKIIKLIGSRIGEGSALIVTGDSSQAENKFGSCSNGLELLVQKAKGNKHFGCVYLADDFRSEVSKVFVEIF